MVFFPWSSQYETGIPEIDAQHKKLVEMLNTLYESMTAGNATGQLGPLLDGLASYCVSHFQTEESLMKAKGYADYADHKQKHEAITAEILKKQAAVKAGENVPVVELGNYLKNWLKTHILETDMKYVPALKG